MAFNELDLKRIEKYAGNFLKKRRPPLEIRNQVDIGYRIDKQSITVFEIRPRWNDPAVIIEIPIAKATFVQSQQCWKVFWQRADMKWHSYEPHAVVKTVEEFFAIIDADEFGCFWG